MLLIIFLFLIKLLNSSFVVILHLPSLSFARPNILLDILLPIINNFYFIDLFNTLVSIAYMLPQDHNYGPEYFHLTFFDANLLLNIFWLAF